MRVLLINPLLAPRRKPAVYNIGLGYIAASLRQEGHEVSILDLEGNRYAKPEVLEYIKAAECDVVGIGTIITGFKYLEWLVEAVRELKPDVPIWVGNSIATTIPKTILDRMKIDVAVIGEGELTVKELARAEETGADLGTVKGIAFRRDGRVVRTPERELIPDLDTIPFPAWELFPQDIYTQNVVVKGVDLPRPTMYISTARGCPYHCTYCYHPFQGQKVRYHSARRIVDEIKAVRDRFGIRGIVFADDLFITNRKRVLEFCDLMEAEGLDIGWVASARVNLVDEELVQRMRRAGCLCLSFGVETGSQTILDTIKKQTTVADAERAIAICKRQGLHAACSFMIGNVGETRQTVRESVDFIKRNVDDTVLFFLATPYPETELFKYAEDHGLIKDKVALFESYGEQGATLLVNFTAMSDGELLELKRAAEKEIRWSYYGRHPLRFFAEVASQARMKINRPS